MYTTAREEGILPRGPSGVDLESVRLSGVSQTAKDKSCVVSLGCRIGKKGGREERSQTPRNRVETWLPESGGWKKSGALGKRAHTTR